MQILYSNIAPLSCNDEKITIIGGFNEQIQKADKVEIAVGYVSNASLLELDYLVNKHSIKNINLIIGMYFLEGMPEKTYHTALKINKKWQSSKIGEIRIVKAFKYHGKLFYFSNNNKPISAIIGSSNLGAIKLEANNRRQYELSILITDFDQLQEMSKHLESLKSLSCSDNIENIKDMPLSREINTALNNVESVSTIPPTQLNYYMNRPILFSFYLELKVPKHLEKHMDDGKHYTKSNINVCYASPRSSRKARDWFETQITVSSKIYKLAGYPHKNEPFFVVTDEGHIFKAHTTSDNNKQFSAVGDELIMGRWLKGRLVAAGLVNAVNNTKEDVMRDGMITQEILDEYGCKGLMFRKTDQKLPDETGVLIDVWTLSFTTEIDKGGLQ